jgi:hypothetical protein
MTVKVGDSVRYNPHLLTSGLPEWRNTAWTIVALTDNVPGRKTKGRRSLGHASHARDQRHRGCLKLKDSMQHQHRQTTPFMPTDAVAARFEPNPLF